MRNNESGRSMVEMLGVLAVIGVLSIGGIAGYMMAMNRHHSNSIVAGVSARAITVSAEKMMGRSAMHPADMETNIDGYSVTVGEADDVCANCFEVVVSGIPRGVCRYILNQKWTTPAGVYLNDDEYPAEDGSDCREENNTIAFVFDATLGRASDGSDDDAEADNCRYSLCQTCVENADGTTTVTNDPQGTPCEQSGKQGTCDGKGQCIPNEGDTCSSGGSCPAGEFCNYGGYYTPNKCQTARARTIVINGTTYYYPSASDVKSWCRTAAGSDSRCVWGYLSYPAAQDWCSVLGKSLVSADEVAANCDDFKRISATDSYWVSGQNVVHFHRNCVKEPSGRPDGYWGAGAVLCK